MGVKVSETNAETHRGRNGRRELATAPDDATHQQQ